MNPPETPKPMTPTFLNIRYQPTPKDLATVAAVRAQTAPFKGMMSGPQARGPYDDMIGAIPAAADVTYEKADIGGVSGFWCRPQTATPNAAILYLHGGAYVLGTANAYRHFAGQFASRTNTAAFVADYGLAPERPFPAGVNDAQAVYRGLVAQGIKKIVLVGDSAGGGLSLVLLTLVQADADAGKAPAPLACVVMSPWTDLALTGASHTTRADEEPFLTQSALQASVALYLGAEAATHPHASPLYGKLDGLPSIQMHIGTSEVLLDDTLQFAEQVSAAGGNVSAHVWEGMPHVFPSSLGLLDAAEQAMTIMAEFIKEKLNA